jgi:hypothetical protein
VDPISPQVQAVWRTKAASSAIWTCKMTEGEGRCHWNGGDYVDMLHVDTAPPPPLPLLPPATHQNQPLTLFHRVLHHEELENHFKKICYQYPFFLKGYIKVSY